MLIKHLLCARRVLNEVETAMSKTDQPGPHFAYRLMRQTHNKHISEQASLK